MAIIERSEHARENGGGDARLVIDARLFPCVMPPRIPVLVDAAFFRVGKPEVFVRGLKFSQVRQTDGKVNAEEGEKGDTEEMVGRKLS